MSISREKSLARSWFIVSLMILIVFNVVSVFTDYEKNITFIVVCAAIYLVSVSTGYWHRGRQFALIDLANRYSVEVKNLLAELNQLPPEAYNSDNNLEKLHKVQFLLDEANRMNGHHEDIRI